MKCVLRLVFGFFRKQLGTEHTSTNFAGIVKVETIGDCYVAVCGLPEPNKDHAWKMAKFASSCADEMNNITTRLELFLGPGTVNLLARS